MGCLSSGSKGKGKYYMNSGGDSMATGSPMGRTASGAYTGQVKGVPRDKRKGPAPQPYASSGAPFDGNGQENGPSGQRSPKMGNKRIKT